MMYAPSRETVLEKELESVGVALQNAIRRAERAERLISAAPDLLAALEAVADFWSEPLPGRYEWLDKARAAIAKAKQVTP